MTALERQMAADAVALSKEHADRADAAEARLAVAEARLAEVRQTVDSFLGHYGNTSLASFKVAQDLAEGIRQVLDRDKISSEEEGVRGGAYDVWGADFGVEGGKA